MYFPYALSFGIGWCLAFLILFILIKDQSKKLSSSKSGGIDKTALNNLIQKLVEVKNQFNITRFDELKNRENAYSRNPQAFNYDHNGFFKEHDDFAKALDKKLDATLNECNEFKKKLEKQTEDKKEEKAFVKDEFTILGIIGIIVIILINIVFFTKLF